MKENSFFNPLQVTLIVEQVSVINELTQSIEVVTFSMREVSQLTVLSADFLTSLKFCNCQ